MSRLIATAAVMFIASCTVPSAKEKAPTAKSCAAKGQFLYNYGMFRSRVCVTRYADAGKVCRSKSDCLGRCVVMLGTEETNGRDFSVGVEANGTCAAQDALDGCYSTVEAGKVVESACYD